MRTGIMGVGAGVLILGMVMAVSGVFLMEYTANISLSLGTIDVGGYKIDLGSIELPIPGHPYADIGKWIFIISLIIEPIGLSIMIVGSASNTAVIPYQPPMQPQYYPPLLPPLQSNIFCGKCGKPISIESKFCPSCGVPRT